MEIQYESEKFKIDFTKTVNDYKTRDLCDCPSCRNFQMQIHASYPKLTDFLKIFGIDARKPDEPFSGALSDGTIDYPAYYTAFGKILEHDGYTVELSDDRRVSVTIKNGEISSSCEADEYIVFSVEGIRLPNMSAIQEKVK